MLAIRRSTGFRYLLLGQGSQPRAGVQAHHMCPHTQTLHAVQHSSQQVTYSAALDGALQKQRPARRGAVATGLPASVRVSMVCMLAPNVRARNEDVVLTYIRSATEPDRASRKGWAGRERAEVGSRLGPFLLLRW